MSIPNATAGTNHSYCQSYNIVHGTHWTDPAFTERAEPATLAFGEAVGKYLNSSFDPELVGQGGYINYLDMESTTNKDTVHIRFGNNFPRLVEAKHKYDPSNLFGRWFAVPREL